MLGTYSDREAEATGFYSPAFTFYMWNSCFFTASSTSHASLSRAAGVQRDTRIATAELENKKGNDKEARSHWAKTQLH